MSVRRYRLMPLSVAVAAACVANLSYAEEAPPEERFQNAEEVIVRGDIGYRNRSNDVEQILEYDRLYFERFEPSSAGDALKRVPSVTFLSDVTESDGARLRGLNPGYTQILINGERVPGVGNDRSFLLDRIPAELIDRVEVVRSNSASRPGDAVAGAVNIILRDGASLDGLFLKLGGSEYDGQELKEDLAAVWGGKVGEGRLIAGVSRQGRFNPKEKKSTRFGDSPENNPDFRTDDFDNREFQTDVRDSSDTSINFDYVLPFENGGSFELDGIWVETDRTEDERSFEFDDPTAVNGPVNQGGNLETDNQQNQDIDERSFTFSSTYKTPIANGMSSFKVAFSRFESENDDRESEIDYTDPMIVIEDERETTDIEDEEISFEWKHAIPFAENNVFEFGAYIQRKDRDTAILAADDERDIPFGATGLVTPLGLAMPLTTLDPVDGGVNSIEEDRNDAFLLVKRENTRLSWEVGVRYENTDFEISDATVAPPNNNANNDYDFWLPSAHLRFAITDQDRIALSGSRSVRRPDFDALTPVLLEEEVAEENDFLGNPNLEAESAWGIDLGYERMIGKNGVFGVNLFYRDIEDKIELTSTGAEGSGGPGTFIFTPDNVGDGEVSGVEFDFSAPLTALRLYETGFFFNYSILDSEVTDEFGKRRFNDQSKWTYNVGFIQNLPVQQAAFGVTFREQGDAFGRVLGEEVRTSYDADLEFFIEKRWQDLTVRLVGSNLLDGSKDEVFNKFESIDDQRNRNFDEFELETEEAGRIFRLSARLAI